ncbi:MAG TPA: LacI family DNA-binding transcriptional regulator [Thermomicrobiales bacterium]|nr:LacI family DNA-binding transcriptional regulator [Thermomicrobiales bacterium]
MSKRVSVRDVARLADVSVGTVSNYLNGKKAVSPRAAALIDEAVRVLRYRRNHLASSLRTSKTKTLGMVIPSIANPFYTSVFEGAEQQARKLGYSLALGVSHYEHETMLQYLESFQMRQMDGIIINGYNTFSSWEALENFDGPVVVVEPAEGRSPFSTVRIDNFAASRRAVDYLIDQGHRRIAIVPPFSTDPRFLGYKASLERAGIAYDEDLVLHYGGAPELRKADDDQRGLIRRGEMAMNTLLDRTHFTACFFTLDIFAIGAFKAIADRGMSVPDDVAVMGFDDLPVAAFLTPGLTTIAQPHHEMGELSVKIIGSRIAAGHLDPVDVCLTHELIIRQSA